MLSLSANVKLYVPSTGDPGADPGAVAHRRTIPILRLFGRLFGGATVYDAFGAWVNGSGDLVCESVKIVSAHCKESDLDTMRPCLIDYCARLTDLWAQDAIALECNGDLLIIGADDRSPETDGQQAPGSDLAPGSNVSPGSFVAIGDPIRIGRNAPETDGQ